MSWGVTFLGWYAVYVMVAGGAFAAWLVYRLWGQDLIKGRHGRPPQPRHRRVD